MKEATKAGAWSGRLVALAVVLVCAAVLLGPQADPEVLRAQAVSRILREDADRARAGQRALLGGLAQAEAPSPLALRVRVDGHDAQGTRVEAAVRAALLAFHERPPLGGSVPTVAPAGADGAALVLDVRVDGAQLAVSGSLQLAAGETLLPSTERAFLASRAALLPPLIAIGVALVWRRTLPALFLGILAGAIARSAQQGAGVWAPLRGAVDVFGVYLARELTDSFRFEILGFIVALLGMVGVMSRAGGVAGLVESARHLARGPRSAQLVTWAAGLFIFFDDYANCMLVGSTLRPLTDRLRISREKLAYIVDSTAAPVAGLSLLSTWIAFQVSLFAPQLPAAGITTTGYAVFVASLPYRFYCWLALFAVFVVAITGRDFGPMRRAEARARETGEVARPGSNPPLSDALARMEPAEGMPRAARLAVVPLAVTLLATALGIFVDGGGIAQLAAPGDVFGDGERWRDVLLAGSGSGPIFRGAVAGLLCATFLAGSNAFRLVLAAGVAGALAGSWYGGFATGALLCAVALAFTALGARRGRVATGRPHLGAREIARSAAASAPTLGFASVLLFEAWMIGAVCSDLGTADYLVALLADLLRPTLLPVLFFVVAGLVAAATGSSWSTMSILVPNAVPLAAALGAQSELGSEWMVVLVISAVLDGAIFGDHCSPISDTTVLSSVASGCDHLDHVRTQAPYALLVAGVALTAGYLPVLLGASWAPGAGVAAGALLVLVAFRVLGRKAPPGA